MSRRGDERGWVKKVGKIQRMWESYFNVYVRMADGTERRRHTRGAMPALHQITIWNSPTMKWSWRTI